MKTVYDISKLDWWAVHAEDVKKANTWRRLLQDFGAALLPFLVDEKYIIGDQNVGEKIWNADPRLGQFRKDTVERPRRLFKTYPGAAWVLMAYGDAYANLPAPFFKDGFVLPLEWRKAESEEGRRHSDLLPPSLLALADKVKRQFSEAGLAADDFHLHPWHGFRGKVDFSKINLGRHADGRDDDFDSAWGALATGLYSIATAEAARPTSGHWFLRIANWLGCRFAKDGVLADWPFSSVAFDFDAGRPKWVFHLDRKIAVVASYGGREIAVAPNQRSELKEQLDDFRIQHGVNIRPFAWKWRGRDFLGSIRALAECNQIRTAKKVIYGALLAGSVLGMAVLGVLSLQQHTKAQAAQADTAYMSGLNAYNGWGVKVNHHVAFSNFLFAAKQGNRDAMFKLAKCYGNGLGVDVNMREAACWYKEAADSGDFRAMNNLGVCYAHGLGVPRNIEMAMKLFNAAKSHGVVQAMENLHLDDRETITAWKKQVAIWQVESENGVLESKYRLAFSYYYGWGGETNYLKAAKLLEQVAYKGDARAMCDLGVCYKDGTGVEKDERKAVEWYRKAVDKGNLNAMNNLGVCYKLGTGVEKDERQAVEWYRKAADNGDANAMSNLGVCYANGTGVEKDERKAVEWYRRAADNGDANAMCKLGVCYAYGTGVEKDERQAVEWYSKAAEKGDARAMGGLGVCYENGTGVEKDTRMAVEWYRKAADRGYVAAMLNLGVCYDYGTGVEKDARQAVEWYRKAADKGDARAMNNLGDCYENGRGIGKDVGKAVELYRRAVDMGNAVAMWSLGNCYANGVGVEKNLGEAEKWLRKAIGLGMTGAQEMLDRVLKEKGSAKAIPK